RSAPPQAQAEELLPGLGGEDVVVAALPLAGARGKRRRGDGAVVALDRNGQEDRRYGRRFRFGDRRGGGCRRRDCRDRLSLGPAGGGQFGGRRSLRRDRGKGRRLRLRLEVVLSRG